VNSIERALKFLSYNGVDEYSDITVFMGSVEMWKLLPKLYKTLRVFAILACAETARKGAEEMRGTGLRAVFPPLSTGGFEGPLCKSF
jgi:hypothetical protein